MVSHYSAFWLRLFFAAAAADKVNLDYSLRIYIIPITVFFRLLSAEADDVDDYVDYDSNTSDAFKEKTAKKCISFLQNLFCLNFS